MTIFQLIMLATAAFFAYQVYVHIQNIGEDEEPESMREMDEIDVAQLNSAVSEQEEAAQFSERIEEADKSYVDGDIQKAKELLEGIVKDFPTMAEGMNKLAFILSKLGEKDDALLYYRSSLRIDANDDMTHNAIARLLSSMNKMQEAEEHYKAAVKIDDNDETTWFNYASLMISLEKIDEAKQMLQRALTIDPSFEEAKAELERLV